MKLAAVRLFVEDLAAARSFYADLLGLKPVSLEPAALLFDVGPLLIVEPADDDARREGLVGRFAGISLRVDDIEALHGRLKAGGCAITGPPERQAWGGTLMHVKDPSGNIVSFVQE
jgi:catechol 2,3-dioxygenase-like lactoylglutathione lyase family enzyme